MKKQTRRRPALVGAILTATCVFIVPDAAQAVLIDSFDQTFQRIEASTGTASDSALAVEALGGERDLYLEVQEPPFDLDDTIVLTTNPGTSGLAVYSEASGANGLFRITWDGIDGDALNLNPTGLGGIDLASTSTRIALSAATDRPFEATFSVFTDGGNASSLTQTVAGSTSPALQTIFFDFAAFSAIAGGGANFFDVGAIELEVDGLFTATDLQIDFVETAGPGGAVIPEPSSIALLGMGALGMLGAYYRRRRSLNVK